MAKVRSPNYPTLPLASALEAMRTAWAKDHRNKMSKATLAKHLGYTSLNGRALAKIGAVRAYGLIEGAGNELRISDVAVRALAAKAGTPEMQAALSEMAARPTLFGEIRKQFPDNPPSEDNLVYWLITQGFTPKAAGKAAKSYLSTMNLVAGIANSYNPGDDEEEAPPGDDVTESGGLKQPPKPQKRQVQAGMKEDVCTLPEGDVSLHWPEAISAASYQDLEDWTKLTLRKIKRSMEDAAKARDALEG